MLLGSGCGGSARSVVTSAQDLVCDSGRLAADPGIADDYLITLDNHRSPDRPGVMGCSGPAPAQRLDLQHLNTVRKLDQATRPRKEPRSKVSHDPECVHVDTEIVDN